MSDTERKTYEAYKMISDLRDHLAKHDRPIAFLFGAGTSCAIEIKDLDNNTKTRPLIPAINELTEKCKEDVSKKRKEYGDAWIKINAHLERMGKRPNIENILSQLRSMSDAANDTDTLFGLKHVDINELEKSIRKSIVSAVTPDMKNIQGNFPHRKFARWLTKTSRKNPVEIFTVNYDILIECALEAEYVPIFDGFVGGYQPFFYPDSLRRKELAPGINHTRLWKMHGSVTWKRIEINGNKRVIRSDMPSKGEMIYPSSMKYEESRRQPYVAFADRLSRFLEQDDALLIVVGFSFGDEHINDIIFGALENNPRTHVYALQFGNLSEYIDLTNRAIRRPNIIVVGRETGVMDGEEVAWDLKGCDEHMASVIEAFPIDPNGGNRNNDNTKASLGRMKIGSFSSFCDFLISMSPE